jgi:predicted DNA-binding protein
MNITLKLDGFPEHLIERMIELGLASNKTEAVKLAILDYNHHHKIESLEQYIEDMLAVRKMQQIDEEIQEGKRKIISKEEALGKYAKYLE